MYLVLLAAFLSGSVNDTPVTAPLTVKSAPSTTAPAKSEAVQHPSPVVGADAAPATLLGGPLAWNYAAALVYRNTQVLTGTASLLGLRAGLVINDMLTAGVAGYVTVARPALPSGPDLTFGYAGVDLAYTLCSQQLVHLNARALVGAGGASYSVLGVTQGPAAFFVGEPSVELVINLHEMARLSVGAGYRLSSVIDFQRSAGLGIDGANVDIALEGRF